MKFMYMYIYSYTFNLFTFVIKEMHNVFDISDTVELIIHRMKIIVNIIYMLNMNVGG